jgi:group I intron endonuclease
MSSGKVILQAIKKYGIQNFSKNILEFFNNEEEMFKREKEIVTEKFLMREDVYNLRRGGTGGFDYINNYNISKFKGKKHSEKTKQKLSEIRLEAIKNGNFIQLPHNEKTKKKISESKIGTKYNSKPLKTEEHKKKISEAIRKKWQERKVNAG